MTLKVCGIKHNISEFHVELGKMLFFSTSTHFLLSMSPCVALTSFEIQETECVALFVYAIMKKMAKVFGVIVN